MGYFHDQPHPNIPVIGWNSTSTNRPPGLRIAPIPRPQARMSDNQVIAPYDENTTSYRSGPSAASASQS
jgi:hypothetical protein